ncbi:MAG: hypothetical protein MZU91_12550 [Desulfosudis oleivorans]|nr:hypothetical protein [Desulfosudis oleivorans]
MLLLMALIFFSKGALLARQWQALLPLLGATFAFLVIILALMTWLDRRLGLSYAEHMAVAFVSSGKNNATAIAIAVSVTGFSPLVAVPAATLPLFQAILLVAYVQMAALTAPLLRRGGGGTCARRWRRGHDAAMSQRRYRHQRRRTDPGPPAGPAAAAGARSSVGSTRWPGRGGRRR